MNISKAEMDARAAFYFNNHEAYNKEFFPEVVRMKSPEFHNTVQNALWSNNRYQAIKIFRDGAKTTLLRLFISKRCAYGISRTIVIISKSEDAACLTLNWLKNKVERNKKWATFYGLKPSPSKWTNDDIEIIHTTLNTTIRIMAVGVNGQIRGTNVDDYRPDLIVADDIDDNSTTATKAQCAKSVQNFFSTFEPCLVPSAENPSAMLCVLQTPLQPTDIISTLEKRPEWNTISIGCFNKEGESVWPERNSTQTLLKKKEAWASMNLLSLWLKEFEVQVTDSEQCFFREEWLQTYEKLPEFFDRIVIGIDPASSASKKADDNSISMWGQLGSAFYLIGEEAKKGQNHIDTCTSLFDVFIPLGCTLLKNGRNPDVVVETVGYQKILKDEILRQQTERKVFFEVMAVVDKRNKFDRIEQAIRPLAAMGRLYVPTRASKFVEQYLTIGRGYTGHDDAIDSSSMALSALSLEAKRAGKVVVDGDFTPHMDFNNLFLGLQ